MSDKKHEKKKIDKKKLMVRIMCLFLAFLMVGGVLYALFSALSFGTYAAEKEKYIRVGLYYGTDTTRPAQKSYTITSSSGFKIGSLDSSYSFVSSKSTNANTLTISLVYNQVIIYQGNTQLYNGGDKVYIAPAGNNYLTIKDSYSYEGVFEFSIYGSNIQLVNVIELEKYITGVIPNEIGSSYPEESIKAFVITVRSFSLANLNKHRSYGFDFCWTANCQVYRGRYNVTTKIENCVAATKGLVMNYGGKIVAAFYSSSQGGVTAACKDVWGNEIAYLHAVPTPWEDYQNISRGVWNIEYTPKELATRLASYGYGVSGSVTKVEIAQFGENSSYVYSVKVTDTTGTVTTITRADKIRSAFGLYSSNFVCGKAGERVNRIIYVQQDGGAKNIDVITEQGKQSASTSTINIVTKDGNASLNAGSILSVVTAYGQYNVNTTNSSYTTQLEKLLYLPCTAQVETITLSGTSGNFVFAGKGWGHGVGLSQNGMKDLGKLGANAEQILKAYLTGISIVNWTTMG